MREGAREGGREGEREGAREDGREGGRAVMSVGEWRGGRRRCGVWWVGPEGERVESAWPVDKASIEQYEIYMYTIELVIYVGSNICETISRGIIFEGSQFCDTEGDNDVISLGLLCRLRFQLPAPVTLHSRSRSWRLTFQTARAHTQALFLTEEP